MNRRPRAAPSGSKSAIRGASAAGLHPRNRHQGRYDLDALIAQLPALAAHIIRTPAGERSIDFSQPEAVRVLNAALLRLHYGIRHWEIPNGYLCPPVPGRADYVHGLADLLASSNAGVIPRGPVVRALDVGVGANAIYPLIGHAEYGWQFVGTDIDADTLAIAQRNLVGNAGFDSAIELRLQPNRGKVFADILRPEERFDITLCNPPFHSSADEAARGSLSKWRKLGKPPPAGAKLNFGGQSNELWCTGGEASFLRRMIDESSRIGSAIYWFTSLVARSEHLPALRKQLQKIGAADVREIPMAQGNKQSRFIGWTFLDGSMQEDWRRQRWSTA